MLFWIFGLGIDWSLRIGVWFLTTDYCLLTTYHKKSESFNAGDRVTDSASGLCGCVCSECWICWTEAAFACLLACLTSENYFEDEYMRGCNLSISYHLRRVYASVVMVMDIAHMSFCWWRFGKRAGLGWIGCVGGGWKCCIGLGLDRIA